ncbi:LemA family protein [Spirochaeta isovalerica]|uniref:LemA protein n=1 Tax=Spirochaeta isovalerica TaxID=150 RepID=A0A841R7Y0_9SPIO|nr:LemA family protein [Spirochaeta isovalerica]MBB6479297.1 LemA protein [Spirochaeta isovalerica]
MKSNKWLFPVIIIAVIIIAGYSSFKGTYNKMVQMQETVKASWSQVENVYQRRFDLIPNLVETVKGYAAHESETLTAVTEARAKLGGMVNISDEVLQDPEAFQRFQQAQGELSGALQRLMVVSENYPELKANQNFLALQDQLEGTENRIAVERMRFNESARGYNTYIKQFPRMIIANMSGFDEMAYFQATEGADTAPAVKF